MGSVFGERRNGIGRSTGSFRATLNRDDRGQRSFQLGFVVVGLLLLVANLGAGTLAWFQQHRVAAFAIDIYDSDFVSTNYIHKSEVFFARFAGARSAAGANDPTATDGPLAAAIDELDVGIEHAPTPEVRAERKAMRAELASLGAPDADPATLADRFAYVQKGLERLERHAAAGGLKARDKVSNSKRIKKALLESANV